MLDLTNLLNQSIESLEIDQFIEYSKEDIENTNLLDLKDIHFHGEITKDSLDNLVIQGMLSGVMILEDDLTLEACRYPFSSEIHENLQEFNQNIENTLDFKEFLWENIVLEIPLKFTKVEDLSEFHGDGWKVISEEEEKISSNPFSELLKEKYKE